jgi:hypothetical protein
MIIPAEITAKHQVRQEEVFRVGGDAAGIDDAVFEFATAANDNILTARDTFKDSGVPAEAMPAFLLAVSSALRQTKILAYTVKCRCRWCRIYQGWRE